MEDANIPFSFSSWTVFQNWLKFNYKKIRLHLTFWTWASKRDLSLNERKFLLLRDGYRCRRVNTKHF